MFDKKGRFIIENFNRQATFSSFLPGISGIHGIPIWCFYVNRGQAIASFGIENKNHSIMEFFPAHQSYQNTKRMGFRTFIKIDDEFYEPFGNELEQTKMYIGMNDLEIEEINERLGIQINILYYTLPNEPVGGLVRTVTIKNLKAGKKKIELLDGMPAVIPYGIELMDLKETAETMKAWMQVENLDKNAPYYRVRFSTKDSAIVSKVEGVNFMAVMTSSGKRLPVVCDPDLIFEYDCSFEKPIGFLKKDLHDLCSEKQICQNKVPCGFAGLSYELEEELTLYNIIGHGTKTQAVWEFLSMVLDKKFFEEKHEESNHLTECIGNMAWMKSANLVFDAYLRQTYLDNVLRGGYPIKLGSNKIFYVYSRKHGDLERDYNFFSMLPEYYSQGNGNFRDVNQNRRSDVRFSPFVKEFNIKLFFNLIQLDGYNPLVIKQVTYQFHKVLEILHLVKTDDRNKVIQFFEKKFSPGELLLFIEHEIQPTGKQEELFQFVMEHAKECLHADYGEGYWTDHWTYHLDLLEAFLSIYPEKEKELLFLDKEYSYYESRAAVKPRCMRYVKTKDGIRQYHSIDEDIKKDGDKKVVYTQYGKGEVYYSSLMTKLLVILANKFATLDMYGMGIEMEAGKPGWYDALNGLPGMFGSSMAETYELKRLCEFIAEKAEVYENVKITIPVELYTFMQGIQDVLNKYKEEGTERFWVWNHLNDWKEKYRESVLWGVSGEEQELDWLYLTPFLDNCMDYINEGIQSACSDKKQPVPTYFAYQIEKETIEENKILQNEIKQIPLPYFLEGSVHYLKLLKTKEEKKQLYTSIKQSDLYDKKLHMYKVNASLQNAPFEIGRAKAFSPGWLENESIWLHMEYKYILELLKGKLYEEFFEELHHTAIPFLSYETYGRSLLENSSFLVSSVNKNEKLHGRGFVARLSGATAEFLQIWQIMMFGQTPFTVEKGMLIFELKPAIPRYLIPNTKILECLMFGNIKIVYHLSEQEALIPEKYCIEKLVLTNKNGNRTEIFDSKVVGEQAEGIRTGEIQMIDLYF